MRIAMLVMVAVSRTPNHNLPLPSHRASDATEKLHYELSLERLVGEEAMVENRRAESCYQVAAEEQPWIEPVYCALVDLKDDRANEAEKWQEPKRDDRSLVRGGVHRRRLERVSVHRMES